MSSFDAYTHNGDDKLLRSLGLATSASGGRGFLDIGTVELCEAKGDTPATTIKVEVSSMPAQFWRFTVTRPRDDTPPTPVERLEVTTGSGSFGEYWPMVVAVANHCLYVKDLT